MPPAFGYQNLAKLMIGATVVTCVLLAGLFYHALRQTSVISDDAPGLPRAYEAFSSPSNTNLIWMALQSRAESTSSPSAVKPDANRFRLAGTFFIEGAGAPKRKAILDDTVKRDQFIVGEDDHLGEVTVSKIFFDHVVIQTPSGIEEIWIEFASPPQVAQSVASNNESASATSMTNRYGCIRIQENRWRFCRKPILDYYQELLDEPDRMVSVFDTMKPVRDERNKITGYVVGIEGEKAFFDAVGLQQGDIVRSVNSLPMTNRRRAESLIDQFLKDQMNAVVMEVERGGKTIKQVYQVSQ